MFDIRLDINATIRTSFLARRAIQYTYAVIACFTGLADITAFSAMKTVSLGVDTSTTTIGKSTLASQLTSTSGTYLTRSTGFTTLAAVRIIGL